MVEINATTSPGQAVDSFYQLAATLRDSGISQDDLGKLEKIWLQRRDVPAHIYNYAYAAFIAGFTGQPKPDLLSAEGAVFPR
jgi:hypothetical protein